MLKLKKTHLILSFILLTQNQAYAEDKENMNTDMTSLHLMLEVDLNGTILDQYIEFFQSPDGNISTYAHEVRKMRIKIDDAIKDDSLVDLDSIQNLTYKYNVKKQQMYLSLPINRMTPYNLDMKGNPQTKEFHLRNINTLNVGILNYNLFNINTDGKNTFSGDFDAIYSSNYGNFSSGVFYTKGNDYISEELIRLNSFWQYIDAESIQSWIFGDFISNALEWSNAVRLAGFQFSSAFSQRSDIITTALPQFSGSALLPSTLDLYVDQQKIYSGTVPSGPFDIKMLPFISGNDVTLIMKDATGLQKSYTHSYYYSSKLLKEDLKEYSFDFGFPRYNFGFKSNDYASDIYSLASMRYGWKPGTTLSAHTELTTDGLKNIGGGIAQEINGRGVFNVNVAFSDFKNNDGELLQAGLEGKVGRNLSLNVSSQRTYGNYYDVSRLSFFKHNPSSTNQKVSSIAERINRYGFTFTPYSGIMLGAYVNNIKYSNSNEYDMLTLNASANIVKNLSFYSTLYKDMNKNNDGFYLGLKYNFDNNDIASVSIQKNNRRTGYTQEYSSLSNQRIGSFGWGARNTHYNTGPNQTMVRADYRARQAYLTGQYNQYGHSSQTMATATGAFISSGSDFFATNKIGDAFVIVKNAGPNSTILNGGVNMGKANDSGDFLLSDVTPFTEHRIFLDTTELPLEWQALHTEKTAVSGYRKGIIVDFNTKKIESAIVIIRNKENLPLGAGYSAILNNSEHSITGYDGEIYLTNLREGDNLLQVDLQDKGICKVNFTYKKLSSPLNKIGPLLCL